MKHVTRKSYGRISKGSMPGAIWPSAVAWTALALLSPSIVQAQVTPAPAEAPATPGAPVGSAPPASKAATPESLEGVTITGTRIRAADAVSANVETITAEDIAKTGLTTTNDLLRSVPQVSNLGADDSRTTGVQRVVSNIFASSAINLRGLGVEATLELLDGKRTVRGGDGRFFDLNNIPAIALRRIEVVPDGASAIYGSDAVTGVVNLVPYHSYDGLLLRANAGKANGLHDETYSALGGKSWDGGGGVLAIEHFDRSHLATSSRPGLYDDSLSPSGTIGTSTNSSPGNLRVGAGTYPLIDGNRDGHLSASEYAADITNATANRQSNWLGVDALPKQKRDGAFGYVEQDITDRLRAYGEGFYSRRSFVRFNAAPTATLTVPASNYFNQSGLAAPLSVLYSFVNDLGATRVDGFELSRQLISGLKFDITDTWQAEANYSYGKTTSNEVTGQQINNAALTAALANATPAAFSPFGGGGFTQQSTLDSINGSMQQHAVLSLSNAALKAEGPLFRLPGGDVRLAAGGEFLRETRTAFTSSTSTGPDVNTPVVGIQAPVSRRVESAYAEAFIPLIGASNAFDGAQRLQLTLALRRDDYKDKVPGTVLLDTQTTNPKVGLIWMPVDQLKLRGSYGTSFRAPSLGDYAYGAPTFQAAGAAAAVAHAPGLFGLPNGPVAAVLIQGGRLDGAVRPEKAKTWSFGADLSPSQLPGLDLSLTYYHIDYKNQILAPASATSFTDVAYANNLVAAGLAVANPTTAQVQQYLAFGGALTPHVGAPAAVLYGSGSAPVGPQSIPIYLLIDSRSVNSGEVQTSGFDFSAHYTIKSSMGVWTIADTFTYVTTFKQSLLSGSPLLAYLNTYGFPLRFGTRGQLGWERDGWGTNLYANYANGYSNTQVTPATRIASYTTFDLTVGYEFGKKGGQALDNVSVQLAARNLFDRKPPYALVGSPAQTFDTQNASAIQRLVSLNIQKKF